MPDSVSVPWLQVRSVALSYRDFTELPPATNRGQVVDRFQAFVGLDPKAGSPWCAAFVYYAGYWGLYDPLAAKSAWPLPKTAGCAVLGEFAAKRAVLDTHPEVGDVFLLYYDKLKRFAHTGFILGRQADGSWLTLEGNTSKPGDTNPATQREGWGVFGRSRAFGAADRFIRWTSLLL